MILEGHVFAAFLQHLTLEDAEEVQLLQQIKASSDKCATPEDIVLGMLKEFVNIGTFPQPDMAEDDRVLAYAK